MLSDNAIKVLEKRYLLRDGNGNIIETPEMLFKRVANFLGDTDEEKQKFFTIMNELDFLPNSVTFTGSGTKLGNLFACYVMPIEDSMASIFDTAKECALIFKSGGGVGINFSKLRPRNDKVHSTNGISSGPVTFMQVFNTITDVCKQGGVRRGALMGILSCLGKNTLINTLEGKIKIKNLAGKRPYLYCTNRKGKVFIRQAEKIWKVGSKKTVKIIFDDMSYLICTPDHRIMMSDYTYKTASELKPYDSVCHLSRKICNKYMSLGITRSRKYIEEHQAVCEMKYGVYSLSKEKRTPDTLVIHHKDENKLNNDPDNIELCTMREHALYHSENLRRMQKEISARRKGKTWEEFYGKEKSEKIKDKYVRKMKSLDLTVWNKGKWGEDYEEHYKDGFKNQFDNPNHKVVCVLDHNVQDVYDITMPKGFHNFVANNIFVHNCDHPDIMEFIDCKTNEKALNNFNISVGVSDKFMDAVKNDLPWELINPKNGEVVQTLPAKEIFRKIVKNAWLNGEPGLIFLDEINRHNPTPEQGKIESTNPCVIGSTRIMFPGHCPTMENAAGPNYPYSVYSAIMDKRVTDGKSHHHNVTKIKRTAENAPIYKITMKSGLEIEATEYHKFFVVNQTNETTKCASKKFIYVEKKLEELSVGEMLMIYTTDTPMGVKPHRLDNEDAKNNLRFGHFLASLYTQPNLWFKKNSGEWRFSDNPHEWNFNIDVKKIRKSEFAATYRSLLRGLQYVHSKFCDSNLAKKDSAFDQLLYANMYRPKSHPYKGGFYSAEITDFLFNVLKVNPITDTKLPEILWNCEIGVLRGFFQMLFKVNGNVFKRKNCFWLTNFKSLSLLKDIQKRLLCMGVFGEIKPACYKKKEISGVTIASESHDLFIGPGRPIHTWLKNISFYSKDLNLMRSVFAKTLTEKTQDKSGYKDTIESITDTGKYEDVYCATGLEFNTLVLNGFVTGNCGESPLLPYEACCLGSINVSNFVDVEGQITKETPFNKEKLKKGIHTAIDFLNRMIDKNKYPLKKIETICKKNRKVGLGIMGWADALIKLGISYNSPHALSVAKDLMSFINTEATNYGVLRNYQNQTVTAIAPTGTLSIIAGCSSGIEPNFAYVMKRRQADQEMFEVHPLFKEIVEKFAKTILPEEVYEDVYKNGINKQYLLSNEIEILVTANQVPWEQHVKMQAAFQTNGVNLGCSKTVNMLNSATEDDVAKAFILANDLHCKGTTVYRDGSRKGQVLSTGATEIPKNLNERPQVLSGETIKVRTTEGKLYIVVNKHEGKPVEVFSVPSTATGEILVLTEALCRLLSLALRHNVSPELVIKQLTSVRNQSLLSVPINIANCLSRYVVDADKPKCPECKADATVTEGCMKCTKCGWSKCG